MKFLFKAKNEKGEIKDGKVEAMTEDAAIGILQGNGLIPVSIEREDNKSAIFKDLTKIWEGVKPREIAIFFRQLSTLIDAKVSIVTSLRAISDEMENKYLKIVTIEIMEDIQDGSTLSEAMAKHPKVFTSLMINMVKAGELSGNLQKSVSFIAENVEKNEELSGRIKSAMMYPTVVLAVALVIGFGVFTFVLPKLTAVFEGMEIQIPWYTKVLMSIGAFMSVYWWAVAIVILGFVGGVIYYLKTEEGKREFDHISIKLPIIGKLLSYIYIARFGENLSVLLTGGIPIVRALTIVSEVVDNVVYEAIILRAADEVKKGGAMSGVFMKSNEFPSIVSSMIRIGEESGKMSEVLKNVSDFYTRETDRITRNLATLIEPVMIVALGICVAVLVFAILMPIYSMSAQIK